MSGFDLYKASERGDLTEVERLLDSGADVNWEDEVWDISYCIILYSDVHCSD